MSSANTLPCPAVHKTSTRSSGISAVVPVPHLPDFFRQRKPMHGSRYSLHPSSSILHCGNTVLLYRSSWAGLGLIAPPTMESSSATCYCHISAAHGADIRATFQALLRNTMGNSLRYALWLLRFRLFFVPDRLCNWHKRPPSGWAGPDHSNLKGAHCPCCINHAR